MSRFSLSRCMPVACCALLMSLMTLSVYADSSTLPPEQSRQPASISNVADTGPVIDLGYGMTDIGHAKHFFPLSNLHQKHWGESMNINLGYRFSPHFLAGFGRSYIPSQHRLAGTSSEHARYVTWYGYLETDVPLVFGTALIAQGGMGHVKSHDIVYIGQTKSEIKPYFSFGLSVPVTQQFNIRLNVQRFISSDAVIRDYLMNYFVSFNYLFS
jgi:hypothetical protein